MFAQKYITTDIVKTVHGTSPDFDDLIEAMEWVSQYIITPTGSVTFQVRAGKFTYTSSVEISHPNASRIFIQGAALLGGTPSSANLSVTNSGGFHSATDGGNQIIYLRSVHATELSFVGGVNGFLIMTPGCTFRYLLVTGSQTIDPGPTIVQGNGFYMLADINLDGCSIWGFGRIGLCINQYVARMITSLSLVCAYNGWQGMTIDGGQFLGAANSTVILVSNAISGLTNFGGWCWFNIVNVRGHGPPDGNAAVHCEQGGFVACSAGSIFSLNGNGVIVAGAATWLGQSCQYTSNTTAGLTCTGTVTAWVDNSTISSNGVYGIIARNGAIVEAVGAAVQASTPSFNTYGNIGGYIWV